MAGADGLQNALPGEFLGPYAGLSFSAAVIGTGYRPYYDSHGPRILEVIPTKRRTVRRLPGAAQIFVRPSSLEYLGHGLVMFVMVGPVGGRIASALVLPVGQLMRDTDKLDAVEPAPEFGRRDVGVEGIVKLVIIGIEVDEIAVAVPVMLDVACRRILA